MSGPEKVPPPEDDFYVGLRMGLSTRGLLRGPGNFWLDRDGHTVVAPDGRTRMGKGFWAGLRWERSDQEVLTTLLLIGDTAATPELIATWTDEQCAMAEHWAFHEHLSASDNPVTRYLRPGFIPHEVTP